MRNSSQKLFSAKDRSYLQKRGISTIQANKQLERFRTGFPFVELLDPCTAGKGVLRLSLQEQKQAEARFLKEVSAIQIQKFVPASGAASRMFHFLEDANPDFDGLKNKFLKHLPDFAFYPALAETLKKSGQDILKLRKAKKLAPIVKALLEKEGLGYGQAPKGMVLFHRDGAQARTAFAEQLNEAVVFAGSGKKISVHFTLPETARAQVRRQLKNTAAKMRSYKVTLSDSIQSPATDCLAVEKEGGLIRTSQGAPLLRPSGHGALLDNLNKIKSKIIYVKNIDNILPAHKRGEADRWKRILTGVFIQTQAEIFNAQKILKKKKMSPHEALLALRLAQRLGWHGAGRKNLTAFFNRPLRVCGMVPNAGEPGGGPFWTRDSEGNVSAQIIESAEVNFKNKKQEQIWRSSTHFNPVEFVCGAHDFSGKKYDLTRFVDENRGIISKKSYQGREIRVMELPGLWNGSMAHWLTLFVEIPGSVFAPVKTVLDLLRSEHQPGKYKK